MDQDKNNNLYFFLWLVVLVRLLPKTKILEYSYDSRYFFRSISLYLFRNSIHN